MSLQVSLPRTAEASRFAADLELAPTLTLRGRQRAGAMAVPEAARPAEPAPGQVPHAVTAVGPGFTVTLTL